VNAVGQATESLRVLGTYPRAASTLDSDGQM
jgi:hypothetical protein